MNHHKAFKTVLITGCSSGLGLSMTRAFLANQWKVIATVRDLNNSTELSEITNPLLTVLKLDVTNSTDRESIREYLDDQMHGKLDCLINNAGYGLFGPLEELTEEQIRHQLEVNLIGVMLLTQTCLFALRQNKGRIINISSVLGYVAFPLQSLYVASKFALEGFSESLHYELEPHNVQVSLIELGACKTRFGLNAKVVLPHRIRPEYADQNNNLSKFRMKLSKRKNASPEFVAAKIVNLLDLQKMPMRLRVGRDATNLYYLRRFLPSTIFNLMMSYFNKRIFRAVV